MKRILYLAVAFILFLNTASTHAQTIKELKSYPCLSVGNYTTTSKSIDNLVRNFDNKIKIIFSDIDGTLTPFTQMIEVPDSLKYSIQRLKQAKIPLILVTGRSNCEAKRIAKKFNNENTYLVALQGAEIINPDGKIIYRDNINYKDFRKILKEIDLFNRFLADMNSSKKEPYQRVKFFFFIDGKPYSKDNVNFPTVFQSVTLLKSINELGKNFTTGKIMLYEPDTQKLKMLQALLKKKFPNYNLNMVSSYYCEITSPTATKGNAVKKLAHILGVDLKNAAAFGDSENDISMLKQVKTDGGLAVAVGNAMDLVKDNANFVTDPVYEDGFAKAVDKILENNACLK